MTKNFPKLTTLQQVQGDKRTPNRVNTKKSMPRHTIFKVQETKDNRIIIKEAWGSGGMCSGRHYLNLSEAMKIGRKQSEILEVLKGR